MKLYTFATTVFIATGLAVRVPFEEPLNWQPGQELKARQVCEDLIAPYNQFKAKAWAAYVLRVCLTTWCNCKTALAFSRPVFDRPEEREWVGQMFDVPSTTQADYVRFGPIQDSIAYTGLR